MELGGFDWDTWSDGAKVEKWSEWRGEKQIRANLESPGKHGSLKGIRWKAQETSHEEKAKGMKEEAVTASQDVWFEFSSVTMNKTSSLLTLGSTTHMFVWVRHRENRGVRIGTPGPMVKIGLQGEKRWGVIWAHVGACERPNAMNLINQRDRLP